MFFCGVSHMRIPSAEAQTIKPKIELYLPQDNFKFNDNFKQRNTKRAYVMTTLWLR